MCGIAGFACSHNFTQYQHDLKKAVSALSHRGPDADGVWYDAAAGIGLGHRRLAVIDLSPAGKQPMVSDDQAAMIAYNGEVYNFQTLRETLTRLGRRFRTDTDTEVIVNAYREWGVNCLERLTGMFAIALWDREKKLLLLARDRLGIKPLYYYFDGQILLFASELKALMKFSAFRRDIDEDALPLFLHYQYIPAPKSIFKNTYKLPPGYYAQFDGHQLTIKRYWDFPAITPSTKIIRTDDALEKLDDLLTRCVADRLISDAPLGALLSGGIDSSMVVALMQKLSAAPVQTFSIGFREQEYNEAPWAAQVARHLGTRHTELYAAPEDALNLIPRIPEIYDEPFADSSAIPTLLVSQLARSKVTVALSGDGGDEQFCGYVRYHSTASMADIFSKSPILIRQHLARLLSRLPSQWIANCYHPWRRFLPQRYQVANFTDKWEKLIRILDKNRLQDIYRMTISLWSDSEMSALINRPRPASVYENCFEQSETWPTLSRLMFTDQRTYLPDALLTKVDRASMSVALEVRVPLLDHRIVEFTAKLPEHLKYQNGTGKYLLQKLLARYLPRQLFERPKMGFGVPLDRWLRHELKELLTDYLSYDRLKQEGVFNPSEVERKIKAHLTGQANEQYRLWALLMWEMWREKWMN